MKETFTILHDGDCPLCEKEINWLKKKNKEGLLFFEDISLTEFDPEKYNKTLDELMGSIHGVKADGQLVNGVEVFRRAYRAVGLGWLVAPTSWPVFKTLFDVMYKLFARYRIRIGHTLGRKCTDEKCET